MKSVCVFYTRATVLWCVRSVICVCVYVSVSVTRSILQPATAAKHAGSRSGACPSLPNPLCLTLLSDWLLSRPADCSLSDREREKGREREGDGGDSNGVSCHFLFLSQHFSIIYPFTCFCVFLWLMLDKEWVTDREEETGREEGEAAGGAVLILLSALSIFPPSLLFGQLL